MGIVMAANSFCFRRVSKFGDSAVVFIIVVVGCFLKSLNSYQSCPCYIGEELVILGLLLILVFINRFTLLSIEGLLLVLIATNFSTQRKKTFPPNFYEFFLLYFLYPIWKAIWFVGAQTNIHISYL